ncbi:phage virion morphogenesis protein [Fusobacterium sp. SYSU M8D902]|uniref:phage virion morphogenesis protein n=1 Tax=Fusobacterium sp. SYSU M8D902 TaxID=3159562 RepID=UPI0032E43E0E
MGVKTTNNSSKRIKQILKNCSDFKKPLKIIARNMKNETLRNFDNETSYLGAKWKKSARAKKDGGKTLQDTGRLYNSFTRYSDNNVARVGTNVIYARALNHGLKKGENGTVNAIVKTHYRKVRYKKKNGEYAKNKKRVKVRAHVRTIKVPWGDIPGYKFLGISPKMRMKYKNILLQHILKRR